MKNLILLLTFSTVFLSCNSKRLDNTKELSKEIKASQIKRVTNTQLIYTVDEWGKKISQIAQKALEKEITAFPDKAGEVCKNPETIPVLAALRKEYGVAIHLLTEADTASKILFPKEKELLQAYLYSAKNNPTSKDNIQQLNDSLLVYNTPVPGDNVICKACAVSQKTGFALWRLLFDKKQIIRKLDAKQLKE
ncbi:hypothetical protein DYBT9275_05215 [Dyadobacter sp. CECT 9275]|uniref:Lipoprotein n=1 Tax=Dyadobacter helix TaxID=2822344 RepID=A0A916JHG8_9BACT|nr:hypothetical protein [Dyadobacter sp. CECT 9275]CAG5012632.1 hypothetical protein DYBT9275_05215 [Dyadobacter sp. CECT 9275]